MPTLAIFQLYRGFTRVWMSITCMYVHIGTTRNIEIR